MKILAIVSTGSRTGYKGVCKSLRITYTGNTVPSVWAHWRSYRDRWDRTHPYFQKVWETLS